MICEGPIYHRSEALSAPRIHDITVSATASIYTLPSIHLPTWRPRNTFRCSSVTEQSDNSSFHIPLDCHNLGADLCHIAVVFLFYHLPLNITVTVLKWTKNSILWFLILNMSLIFMLLLKNYQNHNFFF